MELDKDIITLFHGTPEIVGDKFDIGTCFTEDIFIAMSYASQNKGDRICVIRFAKADLSLFFTYDELDECYVSTFPIPVDRARFLKMTRRNSNG